MTDILRIDAGVKRLQINDGPDYIEINPEDVGFVERVYSLKDDLEIQMEEYKKRADVIDANTQKDNQGHPVNIPDKIAMMRETCDYMRNKIDEIFGSGISQKVFGEARSVRMIKQFLEQILPYIEIAREKKIAKYKSPPPVIKGKRKRHIAMK